MSVADLQAQFGMEGVIGFGRSAGGLVYVRVTTGTATATVYLQGAHVAEWTPNSLGDGLFLSALSPLEPGKPIRGGIPVIFPWFGPRAENQPGPAHGFARTAPWKLAFVAIAGSDANLEVHLTFTLGPDAESRRLGFDRFRLVYRVTVGRRLTLQLTVANELEPGQPLIFEEALHTYFAVKDVRQSTISGLAGTAYLDKRDGMVRKVQPEGAMRLTGTTDRVYLETTSACTIVDEAAARRILIEKEGSATTVVWNPWADLTVNIHDMEPEGWIGMLCVESANVGESRVTLGPGETHTMQVAISIDATA